jgi:hypothetical protein
MPTAQEVYLTSVRRLPPAERLRLAALILDELTQTNILPVESSDAWSDEDLHDVAAFALRYAAASYPLDDDSV